MFGTRRRLLTVLGGSALGGCTALCAAAGVPQSWPEMGVKAPAPPPRLDGAAIGVFNYQHGHVTLVQSRRDTSGSDDALHGADWDRREVLVRNGRRDASMTLDKAGFTLLPDPKAQHLDYYNEESVVGPYYKECEQLLQRLTGAQHVVAFDHNVRCETAKMAGRKLKGGNAVQAPAGIVHGDYTAVSAPRRLKLLGEPPKVNDALGGVLGTKPLIDETLVDDVLSGHRRYAFINVWRPIKRVESKPLACADASSVLADDLITFQIIYADRVGENYFAKHDTRHSWHYFPDMTPDEVILIKQWDSHGELAPQRPSTAPPDLATFALHSAFRDPGTAAGAPDRESIEVRCVLVY